MIRGLLLLIQIVLLSACATVTPTVNKGVSVVVAQPIILNWGIHKNNPGHMMYQHDGIPGNLASIPDTQTIQKRPLLAIVLGAPLTTGEEVNIRVLGVHEQVSREGLISTIITTTDPYTDLSSLEIENNGALAVIEAGLLQLQGGESRSLGFRSAERARDTIERSRVLYLSGT